MKLSLTEQSELEKRYALTHVVPLELEGWSTYWFGRLGLSDVPIPLKIQAKGPNEAWGELFLLDQFNSRTPMGFVSISREDLKLLLDLSRGHEPQATERLEKLGRVLARKPEDNEMRRLRFLHSSLKPEEIGNDATCQSRIRELLGWFDRFAEGHANSKWFRQHTYELLHFIASGRRIE